MQDGRSWKGRLRVFAACLLGLSIAGCAVVPLVRGERNEAGWRVDRIAHDAIDESSGLVASREHDDVLWTHNDSGAGPHIFAIDGSGALLREARVEGADSVDWEDIAIDDSGHLYIGDFGNNDEDRRDLRIYRVREPDPRGGEGEATTEVDRVIRFRYAEQTAYPDPEVRRFDAESMFWWDGALYLFTKHRSDTTTRLYRIPTKASDEELVIQALAQLDLGGSPSPLLGNTSGADIREDGELVALLTYDAIFLYEPDEDMRPKGPISRIELDWWRTGQVESIAFVGDALVFGNEAGDLFRIEDPLASRWRAFPP